MHMKEKIIVCILAWIWCVWLVIIIILLSKLLGFLDTVLTGELGNHLSACHILSLFYIFALHVQWCKMSWRNIFWTGLKMASCSQPPNEKQNRKKNMVSVFFVFFQRKSWASSLCCFTVSKKCCQNLLVLIYLCFLCTCLAEVLTEKNIVQRKIIFVKFEGVDYYLTFPLFTCLRQYFMESPKLCM